MLSKLEQFYDSLMDLFEGIPDRDLKPFLLTIYKILPEYENQDANLDVFLQLIELGLIEEPDSFNEEWLSFTDPPPDQRYTQEFSKSESYAHKISDSGWKSNGVGYLYQVIKFQSAEMTRMAVDQLKNPDRHFGVTSLHENRWYNFTAHSVLECGTACKIDHKENTENIDWSFLGSILEDGRIYE